MKGTITPSEKYTTVKNISESHTLLIDIEENKKDALYVLTEITKALIIREGVEDEKLLVRKAKKIANEILLKAEI